MEVRKTLDDGSNQFNDKMITTDVFLIPDPIGTKYSYLDILLMLLIGSLGEENLLKKIIKQLAIGMSDQDY